MDLDSPTSCTLWMRTWIGAMAATASMTMPTKLPPEEANAAAALEATPAAEAARFDWEDEREG